MNWRIKGRTQIAIIFMTFITVFVILDQMFWNANYSALIYSNNKDNSHSKYVTRLVEDADFSSKMDQDNEVQKNKNFYSSLIHNGNKFTGEKLVHLDMKGAPPLVSYLKELFPYLKKIGATGLLIEYEDMFPYYDGLENITALNAYTPADIATILELAEMNGLTVMPLVQTFGHLEFVLKLEQYRELREVDRYPQVICPSHEKTLPLLKKMIDQVLALHPKSKYIHIGCDEVYYIGECDKCTKVMMDNHWRTSQLFLQHVKTLADYINKTYPGVKTVVWDDMFQKTEEEFITDFKIPELVEIMVWKYVTDVSEFITTDIMQKYARVFKKVWIASAFKGATGPDQIVTDARYHLANHVSWMEIVSRWKDEIEFKGIAVTGWQRYDHFSVLCELLPVAIPSLTVSLQYLLGAKDGIRDNELSTTMECKQPIAFSPAELKYIPQYKNKCNFPGSDIHHLISKLYIFIQDMNSPLKSTSRGWFKMYNIVEKFSSPAHVEEAAEDVETRRIELKYLEQELRNSMVEVFDKHTINEWFTTYVVPLQLRLEALSIARGNLLDQQAWPRRPLSNGAPLLFNAFYKLCNSTQINECGLLFI